jgi:LEA14-like dessication related protein
MKVLNGLPLRWLPFAILLSGCFSYKEVTLKEVRSVELRSFDEHGVSVVVDVVINNPNNYRIHVKDPDVDVFLDQEPLGKAAFDSTLVLDRKAERAYVLPVSAVFDNGIGASGSGE